VLQYLPDVITHEQTGRAHFWPFAVVISSVTFVPNYAVAQRFPVPSLEVAA
jgi:hypothetical protein